MMFSEHKENICYFKNCFVNFMLKVLPFQIVFYIDKLILKCFCIFFLLTNLVIYVRYWEFSNVLPNLLKNVVKV